MYLHVGVLTGEGTECGHSTAPCLLALRNAARSVGFEGVGYQVQLGQRDSSSRRWEMSRTAYVCSYC